MKDRDSIDTVEPTRHSRHERVHGKRRHRAGSPHADRASAGPQVIARIPRLPRNEDYVVPEKSSRGGRGRLLGKRFSAWTLVGGVGFLVVVALVVPKAFKSGGSSDSGMKETARRTEGPAPNVPSAPRWSGAATTPDAWQTATGTTATFGDARQGSVADAKSPFSAPSAGPRAVGTSGPEAGTRPAESPFAADAPVARGIPGASGSTYANPSSQAGSGVPWQPVPGARRPDFVIEGPGNGGPIASGRSDADSYRGAIRGGLVNGMPPSRESYSNPMPPPARDTYRPPSSPPSSRDGFVPDPRSEYRTAARPRYGQDAPAWNADERRVSYPESLPAMNGPNPPARGSENFRDSRPPEYRNEGPMPGYPNRGQPAGYEAAPPSSGTPWPGAAPAAPARAANPEWVSPPNWVTPPISSSPNTFSTAPARAGAQAAPAAGLSAPPSYPTTGYSGPESWPSADPGAASAAPGAMAPADYPGARFEGNIERPTARDSYERTRPSFR